ncbi:MAG: non-heme iron oxygenase ferredoxin subunit [Pseudogulbenkiania sp.]|nr:non-heme iron oxygenase ferredoxin subunit [Pseudogulbenkiania sp.]
MNKQWIRLIPVDSLPGDDVVAVEANGHEIALYGMEGQVFASDNICTHGHARLCDGFLDGHEIECPLHQGKFDIRSGKAMCAPLTDDLKTYPVKLEDGYVFVEM